MALIEENMSFTLTRKYHNLSLARWKVFLVFVCLQQSLIMVALIHQGIKT